MELVTNLKKSNNLIEENNMVYSNELNTCKSSTNLVQKDLADVNMNSYEKIMTFHEINFNSENLLLQKDIHSIKKQKVYIFKIFLYLIFSIIVY